MYWTRNSDRRLRGFTILEIIIVLSIIGIILGSIWGAVSAVYAELHVSDAITDTLMVVENFKGAYGINHNGFPANGTEITALALTGGLIPLDMIQSGNTAYVVGPWLGSQVNIYSASAWNGITVAFWNLNQAACTRLAEAIATGMVAETNGLLWEGINNLSRTLPPVGTGTPFSPSDVAAACISGNSNNVQLTYSIN